MCAPKPPQALPPSATAQSQPYVLSSLVNNSSHDQGSNPRNWFQEASLERQDIPVNLSNPLGHSIPPDFDAKVASTAASETPISQSKPPRENSPSSSLDYDATPRQSPELLDSGDDSSVEGCMRWSIRLEFDTDGSGGNHVYI